MISDTADKKTKVLEEFRSSELLDELNVLHKTGVELVPVRQIKDQIEILVPGLGKGDKVLFALLYLKFLFPFFKLHKALLSRGKRRFGLKLFIGGAAGE